MLDQAASDLEDEAWFAALQPAVAAKAEETAAPIQIEAETKAKEMLSEVEAPVVAEPAVAVKAEETAAPIQPEADMGKEAPPKAETPATAKPEETVKVVKELASPAGSEAAAKAKEVPSKAEAPVIARSEEVMKAKEAPDKKSESRRLRDGLEATRSQGFIAQIGKLFKGQLKSSVVDELEEVLFTADIGVQTSERLLEKVTAGLKDKSDGAAAFALLREEVRKILKVSEQPFEIGTEGPHVILTIGVNGAGKTTTLGKLAAQLVSEGKKVLLIAGDTFRAAAIEQLEEWTRRCGAELFCSKQGSDPSGTIFDGIKYAKDNGFDVALADTAGRLHNKKALIDELKKIHRVAGKAMSGAPHQCLLVLDATNGQNALMQAREFGEAIPFSGVVLTKIDGTAKGGVIIGICEEFKKPIYFIGIGEMIDDLRRFDADEFLDALFAEN
ncbi:MAG: signal recognition particle-docking protein FtsY [Proteobacteria bacterium]|nr:signal recognition particle-docking protein FtsY [Pseudomonadota bacterium]